MAAIHTLLLVLCVAFTFVSNAVSDSPKALLLFGGQDHEDFLGCLNCVNTSPSSVCNELGKYGSALNSKSIWNSLGKYGSGLSEYSPWDSLSGKAPIIVDKDGASYGYFTVNSLHHDRTRIKWLISILDFYAEKDDLDETREKFCAE